MGTKCCCARDNRNWEITDTPRVSFLQLQHGMRYFDLPHSKAHLNMKDASSPLSRKSSSSALSSRTEKTGDSYRSQDSARSNFDVQMLFWLPEQTLIFIDWDDTLFPSSWLSKREGGLLQELSDAEVPMCAKVEKSLGQLLKVAANLARVVIVTNSAEPWVSVSVSKFMPSLEPLLESIRVIYARSVYSNGAGSFAGGTGGTDVCEEKTAMTAGAAEIYPDPQTWKEVVFRDELSSFYGLHGTGKVQDWKNVLSIGDQDYEGDAIRAVVKNSSQNKACRVKTVKLLENPNAEDLLVEHRMISEALKLMIHCDSNLDVAIDQQDLLHGRLLVKAMVVD